MKRLFSLIAAAVSGVLIGTAGAQPAAQQPADPDRMLPSDVESVYVRLETSKGPIVLELDNKRAPISTSNFMMYVEDGFYDGMIFHRVISNFMIQGGGFTPEMKQKETRAPIRNEWQNGLKNSRGTVAMARLGNRPHSATAQFFINVQDNPFLDTPRDGAGYAVFGKVIGGLDVVDAIRAVQTHTASQVVEQTDPNTGEPVRVEVPMADVPVEPVMITRAMRVDASEVGDVIAQARRAEEEAKRAARAAQEAMMNKGLQWLVDNHGVDAGSVIKHDSGLWSVLVTAGDGSQTPASTSRVTVHYTGWLTDGTKFDSSRDRGQPATFRLNQVIAGWTQGVGEMSPGERRFLIIPPDLGYGERGAPGSIPPNAVLVFDVELIEIPN